MRRAAAKSSLKRTATSRDNFDNKFQSRSTTSPAPRLRQLCPFPLKGSHLSYRKEIYSGGAQRRCLFLRRRFLISFFCKEYSWRCFIFQIKSSIRHAANWPAISVADVCKQNKRVVRAVNNINYFRRHVSTAGQSIWFGAVSQSSSGLVPCIYLTCEWVLAPVRSITIDDLPWEGLTVNLYVLYDPAKIASNLIDFKQRWLIWRDWEWH